MASARNSQSRSPASSQYHTASARNSDDEHYSSAEEELENEVYRQEPLPEIRKFKRLLAGFEDEHQHDVAGHLMSAFLINAAQRRKEREREREENEGEEEEEEEEEEEDEEGEEDNGGRKKRKSTNELLGRQWTAWPVPPEDLPRLNSVDRSAGPSIALREALADTFRRRARLRIQTNLEPGREMPDMESDDEAMDAETQPIVSNLLRRVDMLLEGLHRERERIVNESRFAWEDEGPSSPDTPNGGTQASRANTRSKGKGKAKGKALPHDESEDEEDEEESDDSDSSLPAVPVPVRCKRCRDAHLTCDGQRPCSRCKAKGLDSECHDQKVKSRHRGKTTTQCLPCYMIYKFKNTAKTCPSSTFPCTRCVEGGIPEKCVQVTDKMRLKIMAKWHRQKGIKNGMKEDGTISKPTPRKTFYVGATDYLPRLKKRDWSTVLGLAAIQGWNNMTPGTTSKSQEGPLDRTRARCSSLFNEDMEVRTMKPPRRPERQFRKPYLHSIRTQMPRNWNRRTTKEQKMLDKRRKKLNVLNGVEEGEEEIIED